MVSAVREVKVELGERTYPVLVGAGARHRLLEVLPIGCQRAAIVSQDGIPVTVDAGVEQALFPLDDGEDAKCLESVEQLCRAWTRWGLTRTDVVVAVGGGVVTDTAGFAAAGVAEGEARSLAIVVIELLEGGFLLSRAARTTEALAAAGRAAVALTSAALRRTPG